MNSMFPITQAGHAKEKKNETGALFKLCLLIFFNPVKNTRQVRTGKLSFVRILFPKNIVNFAKTSKSVSFYMIGSVH